MRKYKSEDEIRRDIKKREDENEVFKKLLARLEENSKKLKAKRKEER